MREDALYSLKSMDGVVPALGVGAVRINSDILTWPKIGNNFRRVKVPAAPNQRYTGLVLLFSSETGEPLAIFPDGVMQRIRVGATNGLGVKYMAREDARSIGILGSGWQAGTQPMAACAVRKIETIRFFSPNKENRETFAAEMSETLGIEIVPVEQTEDAIAGADIVMCASNTVDAIFFARWIEPGMHISSIKRPEVEPAAILKADRVVVHTHDGKPMHVLSKGLELPENQEKKGWQVATDIDFKRLPTLPDLLAGRAYRARRRRRGDLLPEQYRPGYQFAAGGAVVYQRRKRG